jgi:solute carrier family 35 protein E3
MAARSYRVVCCCLTLNVFLSILIVLLNKWIYTHHSFPNVTMTWLHFVFTTVCVSACHKLDIFYRKALPLRQMLPLSLTFCGFVVFTNLSLQMNTVGTYQMFKMLTTPLVVTIQAVLYKRHFPPRVLLTLVCNE